LLADLIELLGPDETSRKAVAGQVFRSAGGGVRQYRAPAGYVAVPVPVPGCAVPQYRRATKREIEEAVEAAKKAEGLAPKPARKPGKTAKKAVAKAAKKAKKQAAKAKRRGVPPPRPAPAPAPANVANLPMVPPVAPPSPSRAKDRARVQAEQEAREKAERQAREQAEREQAEREQAERQARERAERQAREKADREREENELADRRARMMGAAEYVNNLPGYMMSDAQKEKLLGEVERLLEKNKPDSEDPTSSLLVRMAQVKASETMQRNEYALGYPSDSYRSKSPSAKRTLEKIEARRKEVAEKLSLALLLPAEREAREQEAREREAREQAEQAARQARVRAERAEQARVRAEREQAERQAREAAEQAEQARARAEQAEQARVQAEQAEQARVQAEQAEQARVQAEQAEQARVQAEQARARVEQEAREQADRQARERAPSPQTKNLLGEDVLDALASWREATAEMVEVYRQRAVEEMKSLNPAVLNDAVKDQLVSQVKPLIPAIVDALVRNSDKREILRERKAILEKKAKTVMTGLPMGVIGRNTDANRRLRHGRQDTIASTFASYTFFGTSREDQNAEKKVREAAKRLLSLTSEETRQMVKNGQASMEYVAGNIFRTKLEEAAGEDGDLFFYGTTDLGKLLEGKIKTTSDLAAYYDAKAGELLSATSFDRRPSAGGMEPWEEQARVAMIRAALQDEDGIIKKAEESGRQGNFGYLEMLPRTMPGTKLLRAAAALRNKGETAPMPNVDELVSLIQRFEKLGASALDVRNRAEKVMRERKEAQERERIASRKPSLDESDLAAFRKAQADEKPLPTTPVRAEASKPVPLESVRKRMMKFVREGSTSLDRIHADGTHAYATNGKALLRTNTTEKEVNSDLSGVVEKVGEMEGKATSDQNFPAKTLRALVSVSKRHAEKTKKPTSRDEPMLTFRLGNLAPRAFIESLDEHEFSAPDAVVSGVSVRGGDEVKVQMEPDLLKKALENYEGPVAIRPFAPFSKGGYGGVILDRNDGEMHVFTVEKYEVQE